MSTEREGRSHHSKPHQHHQTALDSENALITSVSSGVVFGGAFEVGAQPKGLAHA